MFSITPSFTPREEFIRKIKNFDRNLFVIWSEARQEIQVWARNIGRPPHREHSVTREHYFKELDDGAVQLSAEYNWTMENRCVSEMYEARKWQFMTVAEFQESMNAEPAKKLAEEEGRQDAELEDFLSDPYNYQKATNQLLNNDAGGRVQTKWSGSDVSNPGGTEE